MQGGGAVPPHEDGLWSPSLRGEEADRAGAVEVEQVPTYTVAKKGPNP